jgi:hypothetical protein
MRSPCKGCDRRSERCHATCEDYKRWSDELRKLKDEARQKQVYYLPKAWFKRYGGGRQ